MEPEKRIDELEARLARIEARLEIPETTSKGADQAPRPAAASPAPAPALVTSVLGWGGAAALVLAAAYLIRLAIDSGWLTPVRQVSLAALAGFALIAAGFALRETQRAYAGLLPAGGIAILFLAIYGAHLYHGILPAAPAAIAVVCVCLASLWLCAAFETDLYALFAVAGSYSAPFLLRSQSSISDLAIYYSAWSVVFCVYASWQGRRRVYLLALYLALIGFDIAWRRGASGDWIAASGFQAFQFAIFGIATGVFSVRRGSPLDAAAAAAHLPPLLLFYFMEYSQLSAHMPVAAPWIAVASAAAVAAIYGGARFALGRPLPGGELILWSYVALVLFHAGYIESVPKAMAPWAAFIIVPVAACATLAGKNGSRSTWPLWLAVALMFAVNYLRIIFDTDLDQVPGRELLSLAYAALLYAGYGFVARRQFHTPKMLLLYMGHVCTMAAALHFLDTRIVQSAAWGIIALACLGVSVWQRDRILGQSSLLVFGATGAKVLLYDLGGAPPIARIVSLVVLGFTFYFGGMLYQRVLGAGTRP